MAGKIGVVLRANRILKECRRRRRYGGWRERMDIAKVLAEWEEGEREEGREIEEMEAELMVGEEEGQGEREKKGERGEGKGKEVK